jgi:hypothetical protein
MQAVLSIIYMFELDIKLLLSAHCHANQCQKIYIRVTKN